MTRCYCARLVLPLSMARIFITGSADGLGHLAAKQLVKEGHNVVLHARNEQRAEEALDKVPGAETVLIADLTNMGETKQLAADVNAFGSFDAVIHNAGVYRASGEEIVAVNTLAPYILTSLINKPKRLIYLSSQNQAYGRANLVKLASDLSRISYSDSKLHDLMLALTVARMWPSVCSNAVDPGWVPTKMGGSGAPDDLTKGYQTQVWLATSNDPEALVSGHYFYHKEQFNYNPEANEIAKQDELLKICEDLTGIPFPYH